MDAYVKSILPIVQLLVSCGTLCSMLWMFQKFLKKPQEDIKEIVKKHDIEIAEIKASLLQGNDRFREEKDTLEVLIKCVFALLEFEVHYCETEQKPISPALVDAKNTLQNYLSKK